MLIGIEKPNCCFLSDAECCPSLRMQMMASL